MIKKVAIFNHKGGVSKTTTAFNLGWMLARKGKRTLLVDADSQCNLTLYSIGQKEYEMHFEKGDLNNIKDALEPAFKAKPKLIEGINAVTVKRNPYLFLLPGHLDLTEYEVSLGVSFQLSNALGTLKNLPGAFNYLIEKTAIKCNAEYILIDLNPSLSAINQDIFVSSDYFVVPTSPDLFSLMAVKSLSRVLPNWEKWAKSARPIFSDAEYPLPNQTTKFLGYTINDFNLSAGKPSYSFEVMMNKISETVISELIPSLDKENMLLPNSKYESSSLLSNKLKSQRPIDKYCIGEISNFNKLIAISNRLGLPIYELDPNKAKLFNEGQKKTLFWFKILYENMAEKIITLTT
ncbi:MAG TPA: AAA family ATPase [Bacteroidales bacterium]|nr:AAA family ATPase [Bacteroidales bacterium]HQI69478.1 AAA family ATPase [Bacteroidales bacterium]